MTTYIRVPQYLDQYTLSWGNNRQKPMHLIGGELFTVNEYIKLRNKYDRMPDLRGCGVRYKRTDTVRFFGARIPRIVETGRVRGESVSREEMDSIVANHYRILYKDK